MFKNHFHLQRQFHLLTRPFSTYRSKQVESPRIQAIIDKVDQRKQQEALQDWKEYKIEMLDPSAISSSTYLLLLSRFRYIRHAEIPKIVDELTGMLRAVSKRTIDKNPLYHLYVAQAMINNNQVETACAHLDIAKTLDNSMETRQKCFNILLKHYAALRQSENMGKALDDMQREGVEMSVQMVKSVFKSVSNSSADLEQTFLKMKEKYPEFKRELYLHLILNLNSRSAYQKQLIYLEEMKKEGFKPTVEIYTCLLRKLTESQPDEIRKLVQDLKDNGIVPSQELLSIIVSKSSK